MLSRPGAVVAVAVLATLACGGAERGGTRAASLFPQKDDPGNLKGLFEEIAKAAASGETEKAAALTRGVIPDRDALKKALRDDAPAAVVDGTLDGMSKVPGGDAVVRLLAPPGRTVVTVHGATTEEIAAYADGSVAFNEFPGGARKLAATALRPGVKFYEVECVEPGKDMGTKFHMFFWDGSRWRMLGPAWRMLRD
jgi:hypothetical protein